MFVNTWGTLFFHLKPYEPCKWSLTTVPNPKNPVPNPCFETLFLFLGIFVLFLISLLHYFRSAESENMEFIN